MQTISKEEFEKKYGVSTTKLFPKVKPEETSTAFGRVSDTIQTAGRNVQEAISGEGRFAGQSPIRRGTQATAEAFSAVPKVALDVMPEPVRASVKTVGEFAG